MSIHQLVLVVSLICNFQFSLAAAQNKPAPDRKAPESATPKTNAPKQKSSPDASAKADAGAVAGIDKKIKLNDAEIAKLQPFLADPAYAQPQIRSVIAYKLFTLQCTNKVLNLESALGPKNVAEEDRTNIFNGCMTAAQAKLEADNRNAQQQGNTTSNAASLPPCPLAMPTAVPTVGTPVARNLTPGGDSLTKSKYDPWPVSTTKDAGTQIVGKHTVQVQYFNILRYQYALGATVTFTDGPTIPTALALGVTAFSGGGTPATTQQAKAETTKTGEMVFVEKILGSDQAAVDRFQNKWNAFATCFQAAQSDVQAIDASINNAGRATQATASAINAVLNSHSAKIVSDYKELRNSANDDPTFNSFYDFAWPTQSISVLQESIATFRDEYNKLSTDPDYTDWAALSGNKDAFDFLKTQTDKMLEHLNTLGPATDPATKLQAAQDSVRQWRDHFNAVYQTSVNGFLPSYNATCDAWFGRGKNTAVKLSTRDLTNPATEETAELITVVCNPPLTVSTGLGFSFIPERVPAFVPAIKKGSDGKPVNDANGNPIIIDSLGFSSESKARPLYALQINGSIWEWVSAGVGLHATLGAAVASANDSANLEFLAGPSLSFFRRAFFITPAYHLGRRTDFISGFNPGDVKGNLTSLPTELRWKSGAALTITFPVGK